MNSKRLKKKRVTILVYYPLTALICAIGIGGFALLYQGGGASILPHGAPTETPDLSSSLLISHSGMDEPAQPSPIPNLPASGRLLPYLDKDLWGYKNTKGEIVIQPQYLHALEFDEQMAFAAIEKNGELHYGLLTRAGNWQVEPCWSNVRMFSEDLAAVEQNEKWGFIDRTGKTVIPYSYREAGDFHCGRACIRSASAFGYIDPDGELVIALQFDTAGNFCNDMAFVEQHGKWYIINKLGKKIATLKSERGQQYSEGYAVIRHNNGTVYFFNKTRDRVFGTYEDAHDFCNGMAAVKMDGLWGFINTSGEIAIEAQFHDAGDFSEGYAAVKDQSGKWGYIDKWGKLVVPCEYDEAEPFLQNVAVVRANGQAGMITADNKHYIALY